MVVGEELIHGISKLYKFGKIQGTLISVMLGAVCVWGG